jgi:hypothetical protein
VGDLRGREPAQEPEGQGDLGTDGQCGMTAGEDQAQPFVPHGPLLERFAGGAHQGGLGLPVLA